MRTYACAHLLEGVHYAPARERTIAVADGRIAAVASSPGKVEPLLALPAFVNAHDHARTVRSSSFGAAGKPLEIWLSYLAVLPSVDPYLAAAVSLGRSALGGAGAVMVHYTRVQGLTGLPEEAAEVARAARDVGVRIGFAAALKDRNPLVYGPSQPVLAALPPEARTEIEARFLKPALPVAEQIALVEAVAEAAEGPLVTVQYGPTGVQWCSDALLRAVADASARTGRRVHMHLLETRYQREWADRHHAGGIVAYLRNIGLLTPRLTLAHCTWARPDELDLIAESGATVAVNTGSNLGIRSGLAPVAEMVRRGCRVALGLDGLAFDEDDDGLSEMRLANQLHRGWGFEQALDEPTMLRIALRNGRASVTGRAEGGVIAPGEPADLLLLDWDRLDSDRLLPDLPPLDLLFARARAEHIREVVVAGHSVVREGRVLGVDHRAMTNELLDRLRAGLTDSAPFRAALAAFEGEVAGFLHGPHFCC